MSNILGEIVGPLLGGLLASGGGGNQGTVNTAAGNQAQSLDLQKQTLALQQQLAAPMSQLYSSFGMPGYMSGLQGLLASYGYRPNPASPAGAGGGSTVGQTAVGAATAPQGAPVSAPNYSTAALASTLGQAGINVGGALGGDQLSNLLTNQQWMAANGAKLKAAMKANPALQSYIAQLPGGQAAGITAANQAPTGSQVAMGHAGQQMFGANGGTFGNYASENAALGAGADTYNQASQHLDALVNSGQISPEMAAAAKTQLEVQKGAALTSISTQAQQAGPEALLQALSPALGGQQAAIAATGQAANTAANMGGEATWQLNTALANQLQANQQNALGAGNIGAFLQSLLAPKAKGGSTVPVMTAAPNSGYGPMLNLIQGLAGFGSGGSAAAWGGG